jgi:hypothetical protein
MANENEARELVTADDIAEAVLSAIEVAFELECTEGSAVKASIVTMVNCHTASLRQQLETAESQVASLTAQLAAIAGALSESHAPLLISTNDAEIADNSPVARITMFDEKFVRIRDEVASLTAERDRLESELREMMWCGHGHEGIYGDDGEMQCGQCARFHCTDYKREPLDVVRKAFHAAQMFRAAEKAGQP